MSNPWQSLPVPVELLAGSGVGPGYLGVPAILRGSDTLTVRATNRAATARTITGAVIGYKVLRNESNDLEGAARTLAGMRRWAA